MKLVTIRQQMTVPVALSRKLPAQPSASDWNTFEEALLAWLGLKRKAARLRRQGEAAFWMAVAVAFALKTLPCFSDYRSTHRRSGGRPKLHKAPLFSNPHAGLVALVQQERERLTGKGGEKANVALACKSLTSQSLKKRLPPQYRMVSPKRLERLYYEAAKFDRDVENLKSIRLRHKRT
jgi:hypothetical protein